MFSSYNHIFHSGIPVLGDLYPPQFQQVFRNEVYLGVPEAPVPKLRRGLIFARMQAEFLYLLFKFGKEEKGTGKAKACPS